MYLLKVFLHGHLFPSNSLQTLPVHIFQTQILLVFSNTDMEFYRYQFDHLKILSFKFITGSNTA